MREKMVSETRKYKVLNTEQAKKIALEYLCINFKELENIRFGLPEIHDRYDIWNVPIIYKGEVTGEISIDAYSEKIDSEHSSDISVIKARIEKIDSGQSVRKKRPQKTKRDYVVSDLENMVLEGKSELVLKKINDQSIDLVFTSPPYYNARKQYSEFDTYDDYLALIRKVVRECCRVLIDGKFFVINSSHVLVPRASRNESSTRIAVPFDIHRIMIEEGFEFVDDIIWQKPEGAGWASGRGRRFSADRNPMQYKAVPVTEYVMVYRKKPAILIDHFIRNHPNQEYVEQSKIPDGYEKTNVWYISPARDRRHPAIFPKELVEKVIAYYSFVNDVVLDPFGGIGTTAVVAASMSRRFVTIECAKEYIQATRNELDNGPQLFGNYAYKYIDYSDLVGESEEENYDLKSLIWRIKKDGFSEQDICDCLRQRFI